MKKTLIKYLILLIPAVLLVSDLLIPQARFIFRFAYSQNSNIYLILVVASLLLISFSISKGIVYFIFEYKKLEEKLKPIKIKKNLNGIILFMFCMEIGLSFCLVNILKLFEIKISLETSNLVFTSITICIPILFRYFKEILESIPSNNETNVDLIGVDFLYKASICHFFINPLIFMFLSGKGYISYVSAFFTSYFIVLGILTYIAVDIQNYYILKK